MTSRSSIFAINRKIVNCLILVLSIVAVIFVFTTASCMVTDYIQQSGGAVAPFDMFPVGVRIANAVVA